jgi:L-asparaginase II
VAIAVLHRLGLLDATLPERLQPYARLPLRNWAGTVVGEIRAEPDAMPSTAAACAPFGRQ